MPVPAQRCGPISGAARARARARPLQDTRVRKGEAAEPQQPGSPLPGARTALASPVLSVPRSPCHHCGNLATLSASGSPRRRALGCL